MENQTVLGSHKQKFVFSCRGIVPRDRLAQAAKTIIALIGMTAARPGRIDDYPYQNGGGAGCTGFFPLMESYLIIDSYSDLNETEILISTCVPERLKMDTVTAFLSKFIGPTVYRGSL